MVKAPAGTSAMSSALPALALLFASAAIETMAITLKPAPHIHCFHLITSSPISSLCSVHQLTPHHWRSGIQNSCYAYRAEKTNKKKPTQKNHKKKKNKPTKNHPRTSG